MDSPLTNTVEGRISIAAAAADLTVGLMAKIDSAGKAALAGSSYAPVAARFVVLDSDDVNATLVPIEPGRQVRVTLSGTCTPGEELACTSEGKAIRLADTMGLCPILVAEEAGVNGQLVLARGLAAYVKPDPAAELPAISTGDAHKALVVKSDESGVEWEALPAAELPAIASGDAAKVLTVKADETGVEFSRCPTHPAGSTWGQQVQNGTDYAVIILNQEGFHVQNEGGNLHSFLRTGAILLTLPTSDPGVAGQLWNDSGTLKISAGI